MKKSWMAAAMVLSTAACSVVPQTGGDLSGTWRLDTIGGRSLVDIPEAAIAFDKELHMAATVGCNRIFGSYQIDEKNHLTIPPAASTLMACHGAIAEAESELHRVLSNIKQGSFQIQNNKLLIKNRRGTTVLEATRLSDDVDK